MPAENRHARRAWLRAAITAANIARRSGRAFRYMVMTSELPLGGRRPLCIASRLGRRFLLAAAEIMLGDQF